MQKDNFLHNKLAWKSFLSSMAKNLEEFDGIYSWKMMGKTQIAITRPIKESDLNYLGQFNSFSSFYLSLEDIGILSAVYDVSKSRDDSVVIPVKGFSLSGRDYTRIRTCVNRNERLNLTLENDYRKIEDIMDLLARWDDTCGEKHFQSRTGKNRYFFKNNLHREGISLFIYDKEKLIAFGVLSEPNNGCSAYVIGKALCYDYKGLSEYADVMLYKKAEQYGIEEINLGGGKDSVVDYKMKFPNAYTIPSFDIKAEKLCNTKT